MPRAKPPTSLFNLCVENVTNHIDKWCSKPEVARLFDLLPSCFLSRIIDVLRENKRLKTEYFEILLRDQLTVLDLTDEVNGDVADHLHLACLKCPKLKTLKLNGKRHEDKKKKQLLDRTDYLEEINILPYILNFQNLEILNLSFTQASNYCLFLLGVYCTKLKELDVRGCQITDEGIEALCIGTDTDGGQCKDIRKLKLNGFNVSDGAVVTAVYNLPKLEKIDYPHMVDLLTEVQELNGDLLLPQFSLTKMVSYNDYSPYIRGRISLFVAMCPSVVNVDIQPQDGLRDEDLLGLLALKTIRKLSIGDTNQLSSSITFDGGVLPLLKKFGSSLVRLQLYYVSHISIPAIMEFCPNLSVLSLWYKDSESVKSYERAKSGLKLKKLERLTLLIEPGDDVGLVPTDVMLLLLSSSPALNDVYIDSCDTLTNELLEKVLKINQFSNLKNLELYDCSVSRKGIEFLMRESNPIQTIRWVNGRDNEKFFEMWNEAAKRKNWDFVMDSGEIFSDSEDDEDEDE